MEIYLVIIFWPLLFQHWGKSGYGEGLLILAEASAKCNLSLLFICQFLLQSHRTRDGCITLSSPTQAAVPGLGLAGEPKGQCASTEVLAAKV